MYKIFSGQIKGDDFKMNIMLLSCAQVLLIASTGIGALDKGLSTLKNLSIGVIAGIGVVVLCWGGFELGSALFQHDTSQLPNAAKKMVAGVIMICIGAIVGLFV